MLGIYSFQSISQNSRICNFTMGGHFILSEMLLFLAASLPSLSMIQTQVNQRPVIRNHSLLKTIYSNQNAPASSISARAFYYLIIYSEFLDLYYSIYYFSLFISIYGFLYFISEAAINNPCSSASNLPSIYIKLPR